MSTTADADTWTGTPVYGTSSLEPDASGERLANATPPARKRPHKSHLQLPHRSRIADGGSAGALEAEVAEGAFGFGHALADPVEVLAREGQQVHRRPRDDGGRPLSRQEEPDLAERVARAQRLGRLTTLVRDVGLALLDEVDGRSVVVDRDDLGARLDLELGHRRSQLVQLLSGEIGEARKRRDSARVHEEIVPQRRAVRPKIASSVTRVQATVLSDASARPLVLALVPAFAAASGIGSEDRRRLETVVSGLVDFTLDNAYPDDDLGEIQVTLDVEDELVHVTVHDWGLPFLSAGGVFGPL